MSKNDTFYFVKIVILYEISNYSTKIFFSHTVSNRLFVYISAGITMEFFIKNTKCKQNRTNGAS